MQNMKPNIGRSKMAQWKGRDILEQEVSFKVLGDGIGADLTVTLINADPTP